MLFCHFFTDINNIYYIKNKENYLVMRNLLLNFLSKF